MRVHKQDGDRQHEPTPNTGADPADGQRRTRAKRFTSAVTANVGAATNIATEPVGQGCADDKAHDALIAEALAIMESRLQYRDVALPGPRAVADYLRLRLADREHEVFVVLFLDAQQECGGGLRTTTWDS